MIYRKLTRKQNNCTVGYIT